MLEDYKKIMDKIVVSSKLENNTIEKLRDRANQNSNKFKLFKVTNKSVKNNARSLRNFGTAAACAVIAILSIVSLNKIQLLSRIESTKSPQIIVQNQTTKNETPVQNKETMRYSPDTVQYRLQNEEPTSIGNSATLDVKAPSHTNIKSLYGSSDAVIKGYVYSTEYFWVKSEPLTTLYTKSVIVVEKSYKPGIKQGERITVFETGGVTTLKDYVDKTSVDEKKDFETKPANFDPYFGKSPDTLIDYKNLFGISAMRTGQEAVLFLKRNDSKNLGEYSGLGYWVNSAEGGKMVLDKGTYTQIIPEVYNNLIENNSVGENNLDKLIRYASGEGEKP